MSFIAYDFIMNHSSSTEMNLLRNDTPDDIMATMENNFENLKALYNHFLTLLTNP